MDINAASPVNQAERESAQIYQFQQKHDIRAVVIEGNPWFYAMDVCSAVALSDTNKALLGLDDDEKCEHEQYSGSGRKPLLINESGLYSLILRSRKPEAKVFRKWVTAEVLPSIRRTGAYNRQADVADRIHVLENAVINIHGLATDGLSQVEAIAKLALLALQTPDAYRHPENLAIALEAIWGIAQTNNACVDSEAESADCKVSDKAGNLRWAACRVAREAWS